MCCTGYITCHHIVKWGILYKTFLVCVTKQSANTTLFDVHVWPMYLKHNLSGSLHHQSMCDMRRRLTCIVADPPSDSGQQVFLHGGSIKSHFSTSVFFFSPSPNLFQMSSYPKVQLQADKFDMGSSPSANDECQRLVTLMC